MVLEGRISLKEAALSMGVSYRQAKRLFKKFRERVAKGLVPGNRGRPAPNALPQEIRERVIDLSLGAYAGFTDSHFCEKLGEIEGIHVSRESVRKLRRAAGQKPKRRRRPRNPQEGMMAIWGGSPHAWFGQQHPLCCLMAAIDAATSKLLEAFFIDYECSQAYLLLLRQIIITHGIPLAIYQDRHSALRRNDDFWTLEEQLAGEQTPTQVGQALRDLGITPIFANSPQAKGRVERPFSVLQDRLVAELGLNAITNIQTANVSLHDLFIDDYNRRFAIPPEQAQPAWRKPPPGLDLEAAISFRYQATVANDNAVRLDGLIIDSPPGPAGRRGYAKAKVDVRQLLDGAWRIYHQGKLIAQTQPTTLTEPIKARSQHRNKAKAAYNQHLVYTASAINQGDIFPLHFRGHIDLVKTGHPPAMPPGRAEAIGPWPAE
jgi:transposase